MRAKEAERAARAEAVCARGLTCPTSPRSEDRRGPRPAAPEAARASGDTAASPAQVRKRTPSVSLFTVS